LKKISLITLLYFSCIFTITAQKEWKNEYDLAERYLQENEVALALSHAKIGLANAEIKYGKLSIEYGLSLQQLGIIFFENNEMSSAILNLKESIRIFGLQKVEQQNEAVSTYLLGSVYSSNKDYTLAENNFIKALELLETQNGSRNEYYALILDELGIVYTSIYNYEAAIEVYLTLVDIYSLNYGASTENLAHVYAQLAELYFTQKKHTTAEKYGYLALEICEKNGLLNEVIYYNALTILSLCYIENGNVSYAETLLISCKKYYTKYNLTNHLFYQNILIGLGEANLKLEYYGETYQYLTIAIELHEKYNWDINKNLKALYLLSLSQINSGNYTEAEKLILQLIHQNTKRNYYSIQEISNIKGVLEYKKGDLSKALLLFQKAIENETEFSTTSSLNYLNNYANVLTDLGQFEKAESSYLKILEQLEFKYGTSNTNYLSALNNLALLYLDKGDFAQTELILSECLKISKQSFGSKSSQYALALNNIGTMYYEMGNYEVAVDYFVEADALYVENYGEESVEYCSLQNNIALLFSSVDNHEEAISRLLIVKKIELKILGKENLSYVQTLNNLASEYLSTNNIEAAEKTVNEGIAIILNNFDSKSSVLATSYSILGSIKLKQGNKKEALSCYKKSKDIFNSLYGVKNKDYAKATISLAEIEFQSNLQKESWKHFNEGKDVLNKNLSENFSFLSEQEKERYFKTLSKEFDLFFDNGVNLSALYPEVSGDVFNQSLYIKGLLLKSTTVMRNTILNGTNDTLKNIYNDWISLKKRIADIYSAQYITNSNQLVEMETKANLLEKKLYQSINLNQNLTDNIAEDWKQIQSKISTKDIVLEFISYYSKSENEVIYSVIVLNDTCKYPKIIKLFKESEIKSILGSYGANNLEYISEIYGSKNKHNATLYNLIWKPLEKELLHKKNIYLSPTGILHRISLWALGSDPSILMIDMYSIQNLSSSNNLLHPKSIYKSDIKNVSLYGGIAYNTTKTEEEHWKYLEGTAKEVAILNKSFNTKNVTTTILTGVNATETKFKENSANSDLIHVATHGFFFPDPEKLTAEVVVEDINDLAFRGGNATTGLTSFTHNKNPLMRSGLIFAGVNDLWNTNKFATKDDGVLTAYEVTQMDFKNTKIVVLSACETGLGEIEGNEGVYGLQRALKMQGVPYIINSLWQVPDKETQEFMVIFYENLLQNNLEVKEAFNKTRQTMRAKYDPYYWAAFVLIE
jgi:CHAT domain-containing protein